MLHLRRLSKPLLIVALIAALLTVAASPVTAQDAKIFVFENSDGEDWQVRVTVTSLGGCTPEIGLGKEGYVSGWFSPQSQVGAQLNTATCSYSITAVARRNSREVCEAELGWGASPGDDEYSSQLNSGSVGAEQLVSVRHKSTSDDNPICSAAVSVTFTIDPEKVVEDLPAHSEDNDLEARAKRAVEVTDFDVRVRPDDSTKGDRGCNLLLAFTMQGGEDGEVERAIEGIPTATACKFNVFIINEPAPFVVDEDGISFKTDTTSFTVDLSNLVELRPARIAIIQDVVGSGGEGGVSYSIERSCAGVDALPPSVAPAGGAGIYRLPGGGWRSPLQEGRRTAHSDRVATFGPGATYQIAARSLTSSTVQGCSVAVTVGDLPEDCTVAGGNSQTLTWRASRPFDHFDVEFDITCGGVPTPPTTVPSDLPPPPDDSSDAVLSADPDVRITARMLANGKIEFALLQQEEDDSWGDPLLPSQRFFPTSARVDHWLQSSPLTISVAATAEDFSEEVQVRIIARKLSNGKVEFGMQQQQDDGSWGGRLLPSRRFFPTDARVDRWLASSVLTVDAG